MNTPFLEAVFNLLAENLQFPYYQAERRIDIFINIFLEEIVQQHTPFDDACYVLPEYALKKEGPGYSAHSDYLMVSQKQKKILLVELKTDESSFDISQIEFYESFLSFIQTHEKFDELKMVGYKPKKEHVKKIIEQKIGKDLHGYSIETVIIKPNAPHDQYKKDGRYFIPLKEIKLESKYPQEWELFNKLVLSKLLP